MQHIANQDLHETARYLRQALTEDDGIVIERRRAIADRRKVARIPVQPAPLDLDAIAQSINEGKQ